LSCPSFIVSVASIVNKHASFAFFVKFVFDLSFVSVVNVSWIFVFLPNLRRIVRFRRKSCLGAFVRSLGSSFSYPSYRPQPSCRFAFVVNLSWIRVRSIRRKVVLDLSVSDLYLCCVPIISYRSFASVVNAPWISLSLILIIVSFATFLCIVSHPS
jgi:hypothetical protein